MPSHQRGETPLPFPTGETWDEHITRLPVVRRPAACFEHALVLLLAPMPATARAALFDVIATTARALGEPKRQRLVSGFAESTRELVDAIVGLGRGDEEAAATVMHAQAYGRPGSCVRDRESAAWLLLDAHTTRGCSPSDYPDLARLVAGELLLGELSDTKRAALEALGGEARQWLLPVAEATHWMSNRACLLLAARARRVGDEDELVHYLSQAYALGMTAGDQARRCLEMLCPPGGEWKLTPGLGKKLFSQRAFHSRESWEALLGVIQRDEVRSLAQALRDRLDREGRLRSDAAIVSPTAMRLLGEYEDYFVATTSGEIEAVRDATAALRRMQGVGSEGRWAANVRLARALLGDDGQPDPERLRDAVVLLCGCLQQRHGEDAARLLERALAGASADESAAVGCISGAWEDELPVLESRLDGPGPTEAIRYRLGFLLTQAPASNRSDRRLLQPERARQVLSPLLDSELWKGPAAEALESKRMALYADVGRRDGEVAYGFVRKPASRRLLVVFSCVFTHHSFAAARAFREGSGHNVLFVNNPELNWYGGSAGEALIAFLRRFMRDHDFSPLRTSFHYGSMGGYGALRAGAELGVPTVVFNPQVDVNLWASVRRRARAQLWDPDCSHPGVAAMGLHRAPTYYAVGSWPPDVEAFSRWLYAVRSARRGTYVVERFVDGEHAGLMSRQYGDDYVAAVERAGVLMGELSRGWWTPPMPLEPYDRDEAEFFDWLAAARAARVAFAFRRGKLFTARFDGPVLAHA